MHALDSCLLQFVMSTLSAHTVNSISAAAASALEGIKTQSRAGLEYIVGERTVRDLTLARS